MYLKKGWIPLQFRGEETKLTAVMSDDLAEMSTDQGGRVINSQQHVGSFRPAFAITFCQPCSDCPYMMSTQVQREILPLSLTNGYSVIVMIVTDTEQRKFDVCLLGLAWATGV